MQENESQNLALIKAEILKDFRQRVADKIMEQENCDLLTRLISYAQNEKEAQDIAALGTKWVRTGFHFDFRAEKSTDEIAYLKRNENLSFANDTKRPTHKLIIGDNYHALLNLLITYREKIKVIYIDPPYGKDDMGEFADTNYDNAITRDNLLSMLKPRLQLAKMLIRDDGVIFCSIDDKNQAYLKCLFDDVFGEGNFVSCFVWQKKSGGGQAKYFYEGHEYVLIYAKDKSLLKGLFKFKEKSSIETDFLRKIHGKYTNNPKLRNIYEKYPNELINHRNLMFEEMDIFLKEKLISQEKYDEIKEKLANGTYFLKPYNDKFNLVCRYSGGNQSLMYSIISGVWTSDGNTENEEIFGTNVFKDPKPADFIKRLLEVSTTPNSPEFNGGGGGTPTPLRIA